MIVTPDFFGMMYQGSSVTLDEQGNVRVQQPYFPISVGVQRLWDTGAVMTFLGTEPPFNLGGLRSQVALAEQNDSRVLYTFGFCGDAAFPPPIAALREGSRNRPRPEYLDAVADAVLDFSLAAPHRRIHIYELWNEPAIADLYWDGPSMEARVLDHYVQCRHLALRIRARDPGALILSPSLNDLLEPTGFDFALRYCRLMRERGPACDAIAFHLYCQTPAEVYDHLTALDTVAGGLNLDYYCTEFNGPWEAFDILAARGIKLVTLNGQQRPPTHPHPPYEDEAQAARWNAMVARLTTQGPALPATPSAPTKGKRGCLLAMLPF